MRTHYHIIILIAAWCLSSCTDKSENPAYSEIPRIGLEDISFEPSDETEGGDYDVLKIKISYRDGDADLGLSYIGEDTQYPYQFFSVETDAAGNVIKFDQQRDIYSCKSFYIVYGRDSLLENYLNLEHGDTVKIDYNKYHKNFDVQLLVKEKNTLEYYDFMETNCGSSLGGRFPRLGTLQLKQTTQLGAFTIYPQTPWNGTIAYTIESKAIEAFFKDKLLKIRVQIYDRALNESNIVESEPFTLESILK